MQSTEMKKQTAKQHSDAAEIQSRVLLGISGNRTPGLHFPGYFLGISRPRIDGETVNMSVPCAPFTRDADGKHVSYDTQELHAAVSHGAASAGIWHAVSSHWSGFAVDPYSGANKSSRGSTYIEANWNPEIAPGWTLNLHAGRQIVKNRGQLPGIAHITTADARLPALRIA